MPGSAKEHIDIIWVLLSLAGLGLMGMGLYIFSGIKADISEVKTELQKLSSEIFPRVNKLEVDLSKLWGEHHATHKTRRTGDELD